MSSSAAAIFDAAFAAMLVADSCRRYAAVSPFVSPAAAHYFIFAAARHADAA